MKKTRLNPLAQAVLLACAACTQASAQVSPQTLPAGATVVNGTVGINTFANGLQVVNTPGAIIHWDSFSVGANRTVRFDQQTSQSAVLNRVTGSAHSEIQGALQSNGRVFLLNPNGILFGAQARVDTAGLLASTLNISDADFLAGNYRFSCFNATVCESGVDTLNPYNNRIVLQDGSRITTRTAGEGGQVWLIARDRITSEKGSQIEAPTGQVIAAAAREVTITSPSFGQMSFTLTGTTGSRIDMAGDIDVPRGAAGFFADTVRLAGRVNARSDVNAVGQIMARASGDITVDAGALLDVSGNAGADAGAVRLKATRKITIVENSETAADGGLPTAERPSPRGGLIDLEAYQISVPWASAVGFDSSGYNGGYGAAALHAFARGAPDGDFSRHGTVQIRETGTFTFETTNLGVQFTAQTVYNVGQERVESEFSNWETIGAASRAADGSILVLSTRIDYTQTAAPWEFRLRRISASGAVGDLIVLGASSEFPAGSQPRPHSIVPLQGGGWLVMASNSGTGADGDQNVAWVIGGDGGVRGRMLLGTEATYGSLNKAWSLRSGEFAISAYLDGSLVTRVYTAAGLPASGSGTSVADAVAAYTPLQTGYGYGGTGRLDANHVNFNPYLETRIDYPGMLDNSSAEYALLTSWEIFDPRNGQVAWQSQVLGYPYSVTTVVMPSIGTAVVLRPFSAGPGGYDTTLSAFNSAGAETGTLGAVYSHGSTTNDSSSADVIARPLGSDTLLTMQYTDYSRSTGGFTSDRISTYGGESKWLLTQRKPDAMPTATTQTAGALVTPFLLASVPGQGNGVLGGDGGGGPPVTPPVTPPGTPVAPVVAVTPGPESGGNAGGPAPLLELPPPPVLPAIRPTPPVAGRTPVGVPAAVVTAPVSDDDLGEGGEAELLQAARDTVEDLLGPKGLAKFNAAESGRERGAVLQEAAYAQAIGPELYAATENMGQPMRQALFNGMGQLQQLGFMDGSTDLSEGLNKALFVKREGELNADGTRGPARTRLEVAMLMLETELAQAQTVGERKRVQNRLTREMIIAARQEEGETVDEDEEVVIVNNNGETSRITSDGDVIRD